MWRLVKRSHEREGVDLGNDLGVSQEELAELRSLFFWWGRINYLALPTDLVFYTNR
jgi:hypothetical protein